jgi:hypothetical protein
MSEDDPDFRLGTGLLRVRQHLRAPAVMQLPPSGEETDPYVVPSSLCCRHHFHPSPTKTAMTS